MADVVRRAEQVTDTLRCIHVFTLTVGDGPERGGCRHGSQDVGTGLVGCAVDRTTIHIDVGILHEVFLFVGGQLVPVPPGDDIVQIIGLRLVVHQHAVFTDLSTVFLVGPIGIEVGLYVEQLEFAFRGRRDGERQIHVLRVGRGGARIGRHLTVVDIHLTLDIPVVGGRLFVAVIIDTVMGIAVIDDALLLMDEVA